MATNSWQAVLNENQLHGENSYQCRKCGEKYTSDKAKTIQLECEKCYVKPLKDLPHFDPFVQSEVNEHSEIGKQEVVPKIEKDSSDDDMYDKEGDIYNIISNVKVTLNENVEGTVHPLPNVSKTNDIRFDKYDFKEVDMKDVIKEKDEETSVDEMGVKEEEDCFLIPKIEPSNAEDIGPNVIADLVLGFYGRQFLQKSSTEESEPSLQHTELKCNYCLKQFSKRSALMCHVTDVHEKNGDFACGFCEKRFYRKSALIDHERKHTGEKPFVCVECGKAYDRKSYLNIHMQMHGERYPCDICEKTFSLKKTLGKHIKYVHEKVKNFCCEICSKTFGRTEHLKRHIEDMHEEHGENLQKCEKCDSSFRKEGQLKAHIKYVHENEKNFVCDTCAKAFSRKADLDRHIADIHEQSGSNACQFCEKRFYKPHALKIHERKHTNEKPFACGFCDKKYHRAMDKDAHERKHTGEKPFQCESCGASFRSQALKRYHMKSHIEVLKQENEHFDPSDMQPNVHNGLNSTLTMMNNPIAQSNSSTIADHSEEKPFKCKNCGECFRSQVLYQDHMKTHEEVQKQKSAQVEPRIHQPNVYNALNSPQQIMNRQTAHPSSSPNTTHTEERCGESYNKQASKQDQMNSNVEDLKHRRAQFDPSVLQPKAHNALNSPLPIVNNQSAQPYRRPITQHYEERFGESFRSQAIKQHHMISHEEVMKQHRRAQFDPSVLQQNVHNTLYSPPSIVNKITSPNTTYTKCGESFRSQAAKQCHIMQTQEEIPKYGNAQFDPNVYNPFNSSLPLMKKQTALSRSSQSTASTEETPFQCESFRSQAEQQYLAEVLKQRSAQFDPSFVQPNVYKASYSSQASNSPSTNQ